MRDPRHVIFTVLEAFLPDHSGHLSSEAEDALEELERHRIPLILVTEKTRAQLEPIRRKLGHAHPFITEGGGGVFFPEGYFNLRVKGIERIGHYLSLPLAKPYAEAVAALEQVSQATGVRVVGFNEMSPREVAQNIGLSPREAEWARQRDFSEPFFFAGADEAGILRFLEGARKRKLQVTPWGQFFRMAVGGDLRRGVRELTRLYHKALHHRATSVAIARRDTDANLLRAVDQPVDLPQPDLEANGHSLSTGQRAANNSAREWCRAVREFLAVHRR